MYDLEDKLLKLGYYAPSTSIDGTQSPQAPQSHSGLPWGKLALTGLLGAGAAYGLGKYNPQGMMGGFANGVDNKIVNPIKGLFGMHPAGDSGQQMLHNANTAGFMGQFDGIKHDSQLQGTQYYQPGKLEGTANVGAGVAGIGQLTGLAGGAVRGGTKLLAPQMAARVGASTVGHGLSTGVSALGKAAPVLSAVMNVPDSLQIGDKINDHYNIKSRLGRGATKATTVAGGAAMPALGTWAGAGIGGWLAGIGTAAAAGAGGGSVAPGPGTIVGGIVGGTLGAFAPKLVNDIMNRMNRNKMLAAGASARAQQLKLDFQRAMVANQQGNNSLLKGWYGTQTPAQLSMTMKQFKTDPMLQKQIQQYNPNRVL